MDERIGRRPNNETRLNEPTQWWLLRPRRHDKSTRHRQRQRLGASTGVCACQYSAVVVVGGEKRVDCSMLDEERRMRWRRLADQRAARGGQHMLRSVQRVDGGHDNNHTGIDDHRHHHHSDARNNNHTNNNIHIHVHIYINNYNYHYHSDNDNNNNIDINNNFNKR